MCHCAAKSDSLFVRPLQATWPRLTHFLCSVLFLFRPNICLSFLCFMHLLPFKQMNPYTIRVRCRNREGCYNWTQNILTGWDPACIQQWGDREQCCRRWKHVCRHADGSINKQPLRDPESQCKEHGFESNKKAALWGISSHAVFGVILFPHFQKEKKKKKIQAVYCFGLGHICRHS